MSFFSCCCTLLSLLQIPRWRAFVIKSVVFIYICRLFFEHTSVPSPNVTSSKPSTGLANQTKMKLSLLTQGRNWISGSVAPSLDFKQNSFRWSYRKQSVKYASKPLLFTLLWNGFLCSYIRSKLMLSVGHRKNTKNQIMHTHPHTHTHTHTLLSAFIRLAQYIWHKNQCLTYVMNNSMSLNMHIAVRDNEHVCLLYTF